MAVFALIGGKSSFHQDRFELEEKILKILNWPKPKILFIGLAREDCTTLFQRFCNWADSLSYSVRLLNDAAYPFNKELLDWANVFYFCGGSAHRLVNQIKDSPLEKMLREQSLLDKLFCGISAGAILFAVAGMGDRFRYVDGYRSYGYKMEEGLGFLPITVCPHYDHDGLDCYNDAVIQTDLDGIALEDDTACLFINGRMTVCKIDRRKSVYQFDRLQHHRMVPLYEDVIT